MIIRRIQATLLALILFVPAILATDQAQKIAFRQLSMKDGLSQSTIQSILQDKKGFIWVVTQDGLYRFDRSSRKFTSYTHNPNDQQSLASAVIHLHTRDI